MLLVMPQDMAFNPERSSLFKWIGGCSEFCVNGFSLLLRHPVFELDSKPV